MAKKKLTKKSITQTRSKSTRPTSKRRRLHKYERQKYPALNAKYQVANRRELIGDIDYIDQLSEKEKEWYNSFLSETVITNFKHRGRKLIKSKKKKRELYRENNKRNADLYNVVKNTGQLVFTGINSKVSKDNAYYLEEGDSSVADMHDSFLQALHIKERLKDVDLDSLTDAELEALAKELKNSI